MNKKKNISREALEELRAMGKSKTEIGKILKCNRYTIRNRLIEYGMEAEDGQGRFKITTGVEHNWDKPNELTEEDIRFLKKYDLTEYMK